MADLTDYRNEIDEIDSQLISLLERRMNVVKQVAQYKKEHRLPVLQAHREQEVLQKAADRLEDKEYTDAATRFMNAVMEISRSAQRRDIAVPQRRSKPLAGKVGFQGVAGSFSEQALTEFFGADRERTAYAEFEDVFTALQKQEIDYGVLPIENSSTGAIAAVYDLLGSYGFYIVGEHRLRIRHNLLGVAGAALDTIKTVYSHAQGIQQSSQFLAEHRDWNLIPFYNTATSAKRVADDNDPAQAAIASARAAEIYGLQIIAPDIQNRQNNTTRFIVIGRALEPQDVDKISLVFSLENESGTLYRTLRYFAEHRINLVKIESRPLPDALWNYLFYLDFEGELDNQEVQTVLSQIMQDAKYYKLLGAYRADAK
ncbi:prephenate dehydratase [Oscillospiraceae bacterium PP1C4]